MTLEILPMEFAVCKLPPDGAADLAVPFTFVSRTDAELSLVCPEEAVPDSALHAERGFRCLLVRGPLDFSLVGVLAGIAGCLAESGISLFAVSTYDTDYLLVKKEALPSAVEALTRRGYTVARGGAA